MNLAKKITYDGTTSLQVIPVTDTMPSSSQWHAIPLPSGYTYSNAIVIGAVVGGVQTSILNNNPSFEITNVGNILSIMPRSSTLYGVSYTLAIIKIS